jgi:hypothetical protein
MKALHIYAGAKARDHIARHGLAPSHITTLPAAAGGPKGLILGPLDRFLFGQWLPGSAQPIDLVGASIGAWRMSTACLAGFSRWSTTTSTSITNWHGAEEGDSRPGE